MELTPDTRVSPHPDVVWRLVEGEVVLLNVMSGQYYSLDEVGSRVWSLLPQEGITLGALRDVLLQEFDATAAQVDADLQALFERLHGAQLTVSN
jgi:hypothetical protein